MFLRTKSNGDRVYLQIVENKRVDGKVKQCVLTTLGRLDVLQETGALDALMVSMQRFSEKLAVIGAHRRNDISTAASRKIGPVLIVERLWRELGIDRVLNALAGTRKFEFPLERAVFITVLHRLFAPGSDRQAQRWKDDYRIEGNGAIELHQFYRAMNWLGEPLPDDQQDDATPFAPRCTKDLIEERLFARRRHLFSGLDLVFFDTTSIYFEGEGGDQIGRHGKSKDHRPDLKQMVVAVVVDSEGNPVCSEMWPGNTTDVTTLIPIVERLRARFGITNVCIVADRGMISENTMEQIKALKWKYILGVRLRSVKEVRDDVLTRGGRYHEVTPKGTGAKAPAPLKVKDVLVGDRRYIVCLNEDQARKDRHDREAIVAALRQAMKRGDKSLVGNKGYRRFIMNPKEHFVINEDKIESEARYDGKWVLTTNTDLTAKDTALKYKQLWMVESIFRSMKSLLQTRPIYHKCDDPIRGHVWCSFLALIVRKELQDRLEEKRTDADEPPLEWADIVRDLDNLAETEMDVNAKRYIVRTDTKPAAAKVFKACGVALPPVLRQC